MLPARSDGCIAIYWYFPTYPPSHPQILHVCGYLYPLFHTDCSPSCAHVYTYPHNPVDSLGVTSGICFKLPIHPQHPAATPQPYPQEPWISPSSFSAWLRLKKAFPHSPQTLLLLSLSYILYNPKITDIWFAPAPKRISSKDSHSWTHRGEEREPSEFSRTS